MPDIHLVRNVHEKHKAYIWIITMEERLFMWVKMYLHIYLIAA